jgi:ubiquinone/menaquinone biosynthesis C-methylase UbiE
MIRVGFSFRISTNEDDMTDAAKAPVTPERIMQLAWGYAPPLILEAAIRNRVFDVLDEKPRTLNEIHMVTGASARGLASILNFLVGMNFLTKDAEGKFALTEESSTFLVSSKPSFHGGLIRHSSGQLIPMWLQLNRVVETGKPATAVNKEGVGSEFFVELVNDILPLSYGVARELADHLNLGALPGEVKVLDLATGSGVWGIALAQGAAQVRVTAIDWPAVIPVARKNVERFGLAEQFSYVEGDLKDADFGGEYQVATLGNILHSEGEERSKALLKKTFDALAPGGTIAIAEFLVNEDRTGPMVGLIFAVNMLVNTDAGDTFSFEEISAWLSAAGFVNARTLEVHGPSPLVLATKP